MADGGVEAGTVGVAVGGAGRPRRGKEQEGLASSCVEVRRELGTGPWAREELTSVSGFSGKGVISLGGGKGAPLRGECGLR